MIQAQLWFMSTNQGLLEFCEFFELGRDTRTLEENIEPCISDYPGSSGQLDQYDNANSAQNIRVHNRHWRNKCERCEILFK